VQIQPVVFVDADGVPSDSEVIGRTWQYVNKNGGPDRRFAHNPQIPIVRYGELILKSPSGLNVVLQCSNVGHAVAFHSGLEAYLTG
jgi:hypothetical protein